VRFTGNGAATGKTAAGLLSRVDRGLPKPTEVGRTLLHRGRKFDFEMVEFTGADGKRIRREVVRHPGAVVVLPVMDDGRIVLIRNHRASVDQELWELPAGTLAAGEEPAACAGRELEEETGFAAGRLEPLGRFYTSPGLSDELMWAFLATGLRHVGQRLEEDERLTVHVMGLDTVREMIERGDVVDGKTILTVLLADRRGDLERTVGGGRR
jgi:ADP-ribose pyrophosphatase